MADVIGVQTPGNKGYFAQWIKRPGRRLEVLQNWLGAPTDAPSTIVVDETALAGRKVFVYAGNMGVAQGMGVLLDLAERMRSRARRGLSVRRAAAATPSACATTRARPRQCGVQDEIHPDEIPNLYAQCHIGLVALDRATARTTSRASSSPTCRAACRCWRA